VDTFVKMLEDAQRGREEAEQLVEHVNAGLAHLPVHITRERALEILNGCIADYNTIIKRLGGRNRA